MSKIPTVIFTSLILLVTILLPLQANAFTNASSRVTILSQKQKNPDGKTYKYATYAKKYDLYEGGCKVFSLAHGIQWVTGHPDSHEETLKEIMNLFTAPWDDEFTKVIKHYKGTKVTIEQGSSNYPETKTGWMKGFIDGYAYVVNTRGHYAVAVDYVICNSSLEEIEDDGKNIPSGCNVYIQIIDSSPSSSFSSNVEPHHRAFYNKAWYTSSGNSKLVKHGAGSLPGYTGMQYWIKYEDFQKGIWANSTDRCARIHGTWPGHNSVKVEEGRWYRLLSREVTVYQSNSITSNIVTKIPANNGIIITGMYPSIKNPTWYRVETGKITGYIKKDDLGTLSNSDISPKESIGDVKHPNLTFTVKSKYDNHWLTAQPYADKDQMVKVKKGEQMKVTKVILNNASPIRNYWAQVEYKGGTYYACINNIEIVESNDADVTLSNEVFPNGNLGDPKSFDIKGTVKSKYKITKAKGGVYSTNFKYEREITGEDIKPSSTELNLYSSKINKSAERGIAFGTLPNGSYKFKLEIWYKKTTWKNRDVANLDPVVEGNEVPWYAPESEFIIKRGSNIALTGITFDITSKTIKTGENLYINKTVKPDNATNKEVSWSSSNASVATVSNGKVTAVGPGTATITALAQDNSGKKATCTVTVIQPVTSITISPSTKVLYLNETTELTATVSPGNASNKGVTWSSSNSKVTVDQNGNITAKSVGTATITAKAKDGSGKQGTCTVTVKAYVEAVTLSGTNTIKIGETIKLTPTFTPSNASDKKLTWSSNNTGIATVDNNGNVKGIKAGSVTITAAATDRGTKKGTFTITVKQPVTKITLNGNTAMSSGDTLTITASVQPSGASNKNINWTSNDTSIATVSSTGVVTAKKAGSVTITATAADGYGANAKYAIKVYPAVDSIALSGNTTVSVGKTTALTATVSPSTVRNKAVTWTTSDSTIATVNNGVVTGVKRGYVTITATSVERPTIKKAISITVTQPVTSLGLPGTENVICGNTLTLTPTILPSNANNQTLTWTTGNSAIATVANGVVTAKKPGKVSITAKTTDGSNLSASCKVTVLRLVDGITITGPNRIAAGENASLQATITPVDASNKSVAWSSSDPSIATVDSKGVVLGTGKGSATITATAKDGSNVSATYNIQVIKQNVAIKISGADTVYTGTPLQLTATVTSDEPLDDTSVVWSSSDTNIATINGSGIVTGNNNGTVTITATLNADSSFSASVTLMVKTHVSELAIVSENAFDERDTVQFEANVTPQTASDKTLQWSSSDDNVLTINAQTGFATAIAPGTATVTVSATDGSNVTATKQITVYPRIQSLTLTGGTSILLGETKQLTAAIYPEGIRNTSIQWTTSDASILTVDSQGRVTAVANGTATVTAASMADPDIFATQTITVKTLVGIISVSGMKTLDAGSTVQLSAAVQPASASDQTVVWSSSNTDVAVVDANGLVSGISSGSATITATAADGSGTQGTISVTVYPLPDQLTISGESDLLTGETAQLAVVMLPTNVRNKGVTWTSSNIAVATVSNTGLVTAVGSGNAVITGRAVGNTAVFVEHEVTVTTRVATITLDAPEKVNVGEIGTITANVTPATASNQQLNWSSSDEEIAVVDADGNIYGISAGYVTITATTTDGSSITAEADIEIYQPPESITVDIEPVTYIGEEVYLQALPLPEDSYLTNVTWTISNENIAVIEITHETNGEVYVLKGIKAGIVRVTASTVTESGDTLTAYAYVQVLPYTELSVNSASYTVFTDGEEKSILGQVSLTSECAVRAAEVKKGAVWSIEHVSGNNASALGINEHTYSYGGFKVTNSVDLVALGMNCAGSDVYRVTCTINGQSDSCLITVNVEVPASPLPTDVTLQTTSYSALVGETIEVDTSYELTPGTAALPIGTECYLYGIEAFNRYAQVSENNGSFTVTFNKAGTYSAYFRYSGANYSYDAYVTFVITANDGTIPPAVETIEINNPALYLLVGETAKFDIDITPSAADGADLSWSSSESEVVTVSADGTMTAVAPGTAFITATADNSVSATGFVTVTESLLSIDWNPDETIEVYVDGSSRTVIQRVFLTERGSSQLTESPTWSLKRQNGNNLTLNYEPITTESANGITLYGCALILKSVSSVGTTEYELTCSDGNHAASTTIRVNASYIESILPTMVNWSATTFTGNANELITVYPVIQCWPEGTSLPDAVTVTIDGDAYWNAAINANDLTVSRNMMTFSFTEPGVFTANFIYSCANMRYLVPVAFRIKDDSGNVPVRAMKLTLNESEISVQANNTFRLTATIAPFDATNKAVTWTSADTSIARVNSNGLVTGIANGRTTITCTPDDTNCEPVQCVVVVEGVFSVNTYTEMTTQYLQGETGNAVAGFELTTGTAKRLEEEGVSPAWTLTRVSGEAANVELQERNGKHYVVVTELLMGGTDTYQVTCTAGEHTWSDQVTLQVNNLDTVPSEVAIAQTSYTAAVGEEIELDFTPVCSPSTSSIPSNLRATYVGIGDFYNSLEDGYRTAVLIARGNTLAVAFKKPGVYLLTRVYRGANLNYVTECTITVSEGDIHLLNCTDDEPVVYVGGKSSIASTCVIADSSIEELYGNEIIWNAERLSGDCLTVALRADQSSASLYVVNAKEWGEETWRVSCTFRGITDYKDITIHAVTARTELPESITLYQTEFSGMIGNTISVPLAVQCSPDGTALPSTETEAWSFSTDENTKAHSIWTFIDNQMRITFAESGYYGGRLIYQAGNVSYSLPISFAITDEEYVQTEPTDLMVSLNKDAVTIYPEGETNVAVVNAILSESDAYSIASVAAYAEQNHATWSLEIVSGSACTLSLHSVSAASAQLIVDSITDSGDVNYKINCTVSGNMYTAQGTIHVATSSEIRPQPQVKHNYYVTPTGTVLTIDASFYDRTTNAKLCSGIDSIWDNADALASMGFEYKTNGDLWLPTFYEAGTYTTTISNMVGNLRCSQEVKIAVYTARSLPASPSMLSFPRALQEIDEEAFMGVGVNIIDLRGSNIKVINALAFANNNELMRVYIPGTVTAISNNAFAGDTDFVVYCVQGSYTDTWAQQLGYPVIYFD